MFGLFKRTDLLLREQRHEGRWASLRRRRWRCSSRSAASFPPRLRGSRLPPVSDGSGQDRRLLRRADELLREAGCKREGGALRLPNGQPFRIEFLDFQPSLQPHTQPFQANLKRLGIDAFSRIVDAAQYQRRMDEYDFDMASRALSAPRPRATACASSTDRRPQTPGSRNIAGIDDPAVDALIDKIANAKSRQELNIACRALDRVLRSGHYWVPMWYRASEWLAYWDQFSRPATKPRLPRAHREPGGTMPRRRSGSGGEED